MILFSPERSSNFFRSKLNFEMAGQRKVTDEVSVAVASELLLVGGSSDVCDAADEVDEGEGEEEV